MNNNDVNKDELDELIADITNNCDEFVELVGSDRNCIHCIAYNLIKKGWSKRHQCKHDNCNHDCDNCKNK